MKNHIVLRRLPRNPIGPRKWTRTALFLVARLTYSKIFCGEWNNVRSGHTSPQPPTVGRTKGSLRENRRWASHFDSPERRAPTLLTTGRKGPAFGRNPRRYPVADVQWSAMWVEPKRDRKGQVAGVKTSEPVPPTFQGGSDPTDGGLTRKPSKRHFSRKVPFLFAKKCRRSIFARGGIVRPLWQSPNKTSTT